jgi:hydroxypyruvate isomerase
MILLGTIASSLLQNVDNGVMDPLQNIIVGSSSVSSITFNNIPSTYTHLQIRCIARADRAGNTYEGVAFQFNNDTASNYSAHNLSADGSSATAEAAANASNMNAVLISAATAGANTFGAGVVDILDYANTNKYKTIRTLGGMNNNGSGIIRFSSGSWRNTNAVTSIKMIATNGSNFVQYSQFSLYGVKSA